MEEYKKTLEEVLKLIADRFGDKVSPRDIFSKVVPEVIPKKAEAVESVMDMPHIPARYKKLILIGAAFALKSESCTRRFIEIATLSEITKEEIAETIILARVAMSSVEFSSVLDGLGDLLSDEKIS